MSTTEHHFYRVYRKIRCKIRKMFREDVKKKIENELAHGVAARQAGQEGRARVCARRAAGVAIREYLELQGVPPAGPSAVDLLNQVKDWADAPPEIRDAAGHLLLRVDETFTLPVPVDLLAEARRLVNILDELSGA